MAVFLICSALLMPNCSATDWFFSEAKNCCQATNGCLWVMQLACFWKTPVAPVACFQSLKPISVKLFSGRLLLIAGEENKKAECSIFLDGVFQPRMLLVPIRIKGPSFAWEVCNWKLNKRLTGCWWCCWCNVINDTRAYSWWVQWRSTCHYIRWSTWHHDISNSIILSLKFFIMLELMHIL